MYNGIGITTARGTGTNGYVQRNLSFVPTKRERVEYVKDVELKKLETLIEKKGNAEILQHEKKRRIEVKCMEMQDMMMNNGYDEEVTKEKVQKFRKMLIEREGLYDSAEIDYDEFGRPVSKETHQQAQANDEKNRKLRAAFGIGEFDQKQIAKQKAEEAREAERRKAEIANKQYAIVQDDDDDDDEKPEEKQPEERPVSKSEKKKKKKKDHHRHQSPDEKKRKTSRSPDERRRRASRSPEEKRRKASRSPSRERSSHKHSKKHRRDRSEDGESRHRRRRRSSSSD